jgi:hypothetical protein
MHNLIELPKGKRVQDVLPQFADVSKETDPIGIPCQICPSCTKPFTVARKPRLRIRLYPTWSLVPVAIQYRLCGSCAWQYRAGGSIRAAVLDAVERFLEGSEATT